MNSMPKLKKKKPDDIDSLNSGDQLVTQNADNNVTRLVDGSGSVDVLKSLSECHERERHDEVALEIVEQNEENHKIQDRLKEIEPVTAV